MTTEEILNALPEPNILTFSEGFIRRALGFKEHSEQLQQIGRDAKAGRISREEGNQQITPILKQLKAEMEEAGEWLESELAVLSDPAAFVGVGRIEREENARNVLEFLEGHHAFAAMIQEDFGDEPELNTHYMTMLSYAISRVQRQLKMFSEASE